MEAQQLETQASFLTNEYFAPQRMEAETPSSMCKPIFLTADRVETTLVLFCDQLGGIGVIQTKNKQGEQRSGAFIVHGQPKHFSASVATDESMMEVTAEYEDEFSYTTQFQRSSTHPGVWLALPLVE